MKNALTLTGALFLALAVARPFAGQPPPQRLALELQDYAALPITADNTNDNTRAQLARVNYLRDEPGGRRFFVNDLNGPLYILDQQKKTVTTYLDFNGALDPSHASGGSVRSSPVPARRGTRIPEVRS